jgi:hypothetical protein
MLGFHLTLVVGTYVIPAGDVGKVQINITFAVFFTFSYFTIL